MTMNNYKDQLWMHWLLPMDFRYVVLDFLEGLHSWQLYWLLIGVIQLHYFRKVEVGTNHRRRSAFMWAPPRTSPYLLTSRTDCHSVPVFSRQICLVGVPGENGCLGAQHKEIWFSLSESCSKSTSTSLSFCLRQVLRVACACTTPPTRLASAF